jgi:hypothetical protein
MLGICPNPPQISAISKPVFFLLKMWPLQNSFFSPPGNVAIVFFFGKFSKMFASPGMFSWGTFQRIFITKNK